MKKLLITISTVTLFASCQPDPVNPAPPTNPAPQLHTIEQRYYSASTLHIYRTVNNVNNGLLITYDDTVYQTNTTVTFQIAHPSSGNYILTPSITENWPSDTCSVELWIDGVMVAQDGNYGAAGINYVW